MRKLRYNYPIQMACIQKGKWRLRSYIDQGLTSKEMEKGENKLWRQLNAIVDNASLPPKYCPVFSGSKLIDSGWEWAVYALPNSDLVAKVPAEIFPEVNEPEYLNNTQEAYNICRKYFTSFILETTFERKNTPGGHLNILFQKRLPGEQFRYIEPNKISSKLKKSFMEIGEGVLKILKELEWTPDFNLYKKEVDGKLIWSIWNIILENEEPRIFDFTAYYDVFRLYPERTKKEVEIKSKNWRAFLRELKI